MISFRPVPRGFTHRRKAFYAVSAVLILAGGFIASTRHSAFAQTMNDAMPDEMHMHGADGTGHDEVNMPGLRGRDATPEESAELAFMFRNFERISRNVTNLPNGIRTVTYSDDADLMSVITSHVTGMINRVEDGRDPQIVIQSPTLDIFFARGERIETDIEVTDEGIVVLQTSDDPEVVAALHTHAAEVSAMVERGMAAVHDMMMKRAGN
jgi:hypothetical protein